MNDGIRFAETPEELNAAYQLRYKIYIESMGRFSLSCDHNKRLLCDEYDEHARIVIAVKNNKIIGTLRVLWGNDLTFDSYLTEAYRIKPFLNVLEPGKICIVERLMVDENHRGSPTMLRMLNVVMHFIFAQQIELLLINAESQHINSYVKLGCRPFTKQFLYPGIGSVTPMALVVGDYPNLQRVGSPFSLLATADDLNYCQYTSQLISTIRHEATLATIAPQKLHKKLLQRSAANLPLFSRNTPQSHSRFRMKLATG